MAKAAKDVRASSRTETTVRAAEERGQTKPEDPLEPFSNRLPRSLHRRLKVYAAQQGKSIGEILEEALTGYLEGQAR